MEARVSQRSDQQDKLYMSAEAFADLSKHTLEGALAFERGKRRELVVTRIQKPRSPKDGSPDYAALLN